MILVCGIPSEPPVQLVLDAASRLGEEVVLLNQREAASTDMEVSVYHDVRRVIHHGPNGSRDLSAVTGSYVRLADHRTLPEYVEGRSNVVEDRLRMDAWHAILSDWLETADHLVMNRNKPSNSNMSKPFQAQIIERAGIRTPRTLVTNQIDAVLAFRKRHGRIIYKSISAHRSVVQELTDDRLAQLSKIRVLPTQFQELIEGEDIRVHVVEDEVFATRIVSTAVDYRYASDQGMEAFYEPTTLPEDIADKCRYLSRILELPLCGIDFKRTQGGEYFCLEANPCPAYSCFEEQTGQEISMAIVRSLAQGRTGLMVKAVRGQADLSPEP
jgi:glutathione synthase/RimK-type ligase-like ATP-grasp enzyme